MPPRQPRKQPQKKAEQKRFNLAERRKERAEALGGRYVEVEGEDGTVVQVPRLAFWSSEQHREIFFGEIEDRPNGDLDALGRIMDEEEFEKLRSLDLELGDLKDLMAEVMRDVKNPE